MVGSLASPHYLKTGNELIHINELIHKYIHELIHMLNECVCMQLPLLLRIFRYLCFIPEASSKDSVLMLPVLFCGNGYFKGNAYVICIHGTENELAIGHLL